MYHQISITISRIWTFYVIEFLQHNNSQTSSYLLTFDNDFYLISLKFKYIIEKNTI